jgi:hypothetical protein
LTASAGQRPRKPRWSRRIGGESRVFSPARSVGASGEKHAPKRTTSFPPELARAEIFFWGVDKPAFGDVSREIRNADFSASDRASNDV